MKNLVYYIPHRLYRSPAAANINPVTKSFVEMFNPWISLNDRTGTLDIPGIEIYNNSPIPSKPARVQSFSAASYSRIDDCIAQLKLPGKEKLVIFHSGGIDSTLIVSSLITSVFKLNCDIRFATIFATCTTLLTLIHRVCVDKATCSLTIYVLFHALHGMIFLYSPTRQSSILTMGLFAFKSKDVCMNE